MQPGSSKQPEQPPPQVATAPESKLQDALGSNFPPAEEKPKEPREAPAPAKEPVKVQDAAEEKTEAPTEEERTISPPPRRSRFVQELYKAGFGDKKEEEKEGVQDSAEEPRNEDGGPKDTSAGMITTLQIDIEPEPQRVRRHEVLAREPDSLLTKTIDYPSFESNLKEEKEDKQSVVRHAGRPGPFLPRRILLRNLTFVHPPGCLCLSFTTCCCVNERTTPFVEPKDNFYFVASTISAEIYLDKSSRTPSPPLSHGAKVSPRRKSAWHVRLRPSTCLSNFALTYIPLDIRLLIDAL